MPETPCFCLGGWIRHHALLLGMGEQAESDPDFQHTDKNDEAVNDIEKSKPGRFIICEQPDNQRAQSGSRISS